MHFSLLRLRVVSTCPTQRHDLTAKGFSDCCRWAAVVNRAANRLSTSPWSWSRRDASWYPDRQKPEVADHYWNEGPSPGLLEINLAFFPVPFSTLLLSIPRDLTMLIARNVCNGIREAARFREGTFGRS